MVAKLFLVIDLPKKQTSAAGRTRKKRLEERKIVLLSNKFTES